MPKIIETTVYAFEELDAKAQDKALDWARDIVMQEEWWDAVYEDGQQAGLRIKGFDLYRREIEGDFYNSAPETAEYIKGNHGTMCATHETAIEYLKALEELDAKYPYEDIQDRDAAYDTEREELDEKFLRNLLSDYLENLKNEAGYKESREYLEDMITANEYTFTKAGKRFG